MAPKDWQTNRQRLLMAIRVARAEFGWVQPPSHPWMLHLTEEHVLDTLAAAGRPVHRPASLQKSRLIAPKGEAEFSVDETAVGLAGVAVSALQVMCLANPKMTQMVLSGGSGGKLPDRNRERAERLLKAVVTLEQMLHDPEVVAMWGNLGVASSGMVPFDDYKQTTTKLAKILKSDDLEYFLTEIRASEVALIGSPLDWFLRDQLAPAYCDIYREHKRGQPFRRFAREFFKNIGRPPPADATIIRALSESARAERPR